MSILLSKTCHCMSPSSKMIYRTKNRMKIRPGRRNWFVYILHLFTSIRSKTSSHFSSGLKKMAQNGKNKRMCTLFPYDTMRITSYWWYSVENRTFKEHRSFETNKKTLPVAQTWHEPSITYQTNPSISLIVEFAAVAEKIAVLDSSSRRIFVKFARNFRPLLRWR